MFSDDFWNDRDPPGKKPAQITLVGMFKSIATSMRTILEAKHAPDNGPEHTLGMIKSSAGEVGGGWPEHHTLQRPNLVEDPNDRMLSRVTKGLAYAMLFILIGLIVLSR